MKPFSERLEENRKETLDYKIKCLIDALHRLEDSINANILKLFKLDN